jgi:hypothetical protein
MGGQVDLNTARIREIAALPGLTHMLARGIVLDRRRYGAFTSLEDVMTRITGFNGILLSNLGDRVSVSPPDYDVPAMHVELESLDSAKADGPIVFAGPPRAVRGTFLVHNHGWMPLGAPPIRLEIEGLRWAEGSSIGRLAIRSGLLPGQCRRETVMLRLDPSTPPGSYQARLLLGETVTPACVIVTESPASLLSPTTLALPTLAGKYKRSLILRNEGNIVLRAGDTDAVLPLDQNLECRVIRETLRKVSSPTWDALTATAADEAKRNLEQLSLVIIRTLNKPIHVDRGGTILLNLEIQVPRLPRRRSFVAAAMICGSQLTLNLLPWLQRQDEKRPLIRSNGDSDGA